jgi:hypothetical protein
MFFLTHITSMAACAFTIDSLPIPEDILHFSKILLVYPKKSVSVLGVFVFIP